MAKRLITLGKTWVIRGHLASCLFVLLTLTLPQESKAALIECSTTGAPGSSIGCLAPGAYYCIHTFGTGCQGHIGGPPDNGTYTNCTVQSPPWPPNHQVCQWSGGAPVGAPVPELEEYAAIAFITLALLIGWRVRHKYRPVS